MPDGKALKGPSASLRQEEKNLSLALSELFTGLDVSLRTYAARMGEDAGTVSRYMSCDRIPPWKFIEDLLVETTVKRNGIPPTSEVVAHLKTLHMAALSIQTSAFYKRMLLEHELRESDACVQRLKQREADTSAELEHAKREIAQLKVDARKQDHKIYEMHLEYEAKLDVYRREERSKHNALLVVVFRLTAELAQVSAERLEMERQMVELEGMIQQIEATPISEPEIRIEGSKAARTEIANMPDFGPLGPLDFREPEKAGRRIERMNLDVVVSVMNRIRSDKAAAALGYVRPERVEIILDAMEPDRARRIHVHLDRSGRRPHQPA